MPVYTYELKGKIFDFLNKDPAIKKPEYDRDYAFCKHLERSRAIKNIQFEIFMEFYQNLDTVKINGQDYKYSKVTYNGKTQNAYCKGDMNTEKALYKLADAFYKEA